jgi:hypothetical protein
LLIPLRFQIPATESGWTLYDASVALQITSKVLPIVMIHTIISDQLSFNHDSKPTNHQTNKHTNKTNKQTKQTYMQTNIHANKQTNQPTTTTNTLTSIIDGNIKITIPESPSPAPIQRLI